MKGYESNGKKTLIHKGQKSGYDFLRNRKESGGRLDSGGHALESSGGEGAGEETAGLLAEHGHSTTRRSHAEGDASESPEVDRRVMPTWVSAESGAGETEET